MENDYQLNQKFLYKLRKKAELCRYSHSELKERYTKFRNVKEFTVTLLSVLSVLLISLYCLKTLAGYFVLIAILILSSAITITQALDHTIFQWTHKMVRHEAAVAIWGDWIRKADFFEKRICQYPSDLANEKMQNIQEKYNSCMSRTEQIPNSNFLKFKKKFTLYKLKSKKIGQMSLEDLEIGKKNEKH